MLNSYICNVDQNPLYLHNVRTEIVAVTKIFTCE